MVIFHSGSCQPDDSEATPVPQRQHRLKNVTKKLPINTTLTQYGNHDMTNCTIFTNKNKTTSHSTANVATVSNAGSYNDSRQHTSTTPAERTLHEPVVVEDLQERDEDSGVQTISSSSARNNGRMQNVPRGAHPPFISKVLQVH